MREDQMIAWAILLLGWALPALHVILSPRGGPVRPPEGSRCPFGPRVGWLITVLLIGPLGWLLYIRGRNRHRQVPVDRPEIDGAGPL